MISHSITNTSHLSSASVFRGVWETDCRWEAPPPDSFSPLSACFRDEKSNSCSSPLDSLSYFSSCLALLWPCRKVS